MDSVIVSHCDDPLVPEDPHHKALSVIVPFMSDQTLPQAPRNIYAYNRGNYTQINSALLQYDWNTLLCAGDVESAVRSFYQILYELRDRYVPLTKQKVKKFPPWYNIPLIKSIKEKYKYLMKYRTYGNLNDKLSFQLR